jgi:plastocyanin
MNIKKRSILVITTAFLCCLLNTNLWATSLKPDLDAFSQNQKIRWLIFTEMFQPVIEQQSTVIYYKINNDVNYREALVTLASRLYQSTTSLVEVLNPKISDLDLLTLALETEVDFFITFSDSGEIAEIVSNTIFTGIKVSLGDRKAFYEYCAKHLVSSFVKIYNVFQLFKLTKILELNRTLVDLMLSYYNAGGNLQKVLSHFNIDPSDYEDTNSDFDCIVKYFSTKNSVDYDDLLQAAHKTFANVSQVYHNIENSHSLIPTKPRLYPPANITDPENILFTWGRSTCNQCQNVSYSLEIHQNNEMIFNVNDFTGKLIEETSYVLPVSLEYDTTYYWAVFPKSNSDIWNLNVDFESFRIDSPPADVILYQSAIHKIVPEKLKMKPGESKILTISYQNRSSVDWKSDTANAHYVELRSIDASGNPADSVLFPDNDSWINSKRVCTQNSANVASASHENAWFIFDIAIPPNISSNYLTVFFRLYNPEHGFFGEVASIFIEIDHASNEPVTTEKKVWSFQTNAESWTARNATNDGIVFNDYWIINPYTDSASKSGVVSPYPLESISSQTFDTFEVRAAVKNQFVDSIDVHFMINNSWMPPQKMVYYSGARQANSQCVYQCDINYSASIERVRVDFVWGEESADDRVFIDYIQFVKSTQQNIDLNQPYAQLSAQYLRDENTFLFKYWVNAYTDAFYIDYSFTNGNEWTTIFGKDSITLQEGTQHVSIAKSLENNQIQFKINAFNTTNTAQYTSNIISLNYEPQKPYIQKSTEAPYAPTLYSIGTSTSHDHVKLAWKSVVDSHNNDNVNFYEIRYATHSSLTNAITINIGNPYNKTSGVEILEYTVTGLSDNQTYYFQVRATNNVDTGDWSNIKSIKIDIQDFPYFDLSYQLPENNAVGVSKTPVLGWKAEDPDGDTLYYDLLLGTDPNNLNIEPVGFDISDSYDFSTDSTYIMVLKPATTYYWQVLVAEKGKDKDDYPNGAYIRSPLWQFTTTGEGSDLAIMNAEAVDEILPDTTVYFNVTVKNKGTETAKLQRISSSYVKNDQESPFYRCYGFKDDYLEPGQEIILPVKVTFMDEIWEYNGKYYDNVLVSGTSYIKFYFYRNDEQDINLTNNTYTLPIQYVDAGGPVVTAFDIKEHCTLYQTRPCVDDEFWANMGESLEFIIEAHDDVMISTVDFQYKLSQDDSWQQISQVKHNDPEFQTHSRMTENFWQIPTNISETHTAQVRVILCDDKNNCTTKTSDEFSIYSNQIESEITTDLTAYHVNENLTFHINATSNYALRSIYVKLIYGTEDITIINERDDNGINNQIQYDWQIPNDNDFASNNCYLELHLTDVRWNIIDVRSNRFKITPKTELPSPFNQSIVLYNDEFDFPENARLQKQSIDTQFVKLDSNNIAHTIVNHMYQYSLDTGVDYDEDTTIYHSNSYYITYDPSQESISDKMMVCNKDYEVMDFDMIDGIPHAILRHSVFQDQYFYTYKQGDAFVNPIIIENSIIPSIGSFTKINQTADNFGNLEINPAYHIFLNGYLWDLDLGHWSGRVRRYLFADGKIGNEEKLNIQNNAGEVKSRYYIKPAHDGNTIYFIDSYQKKFITFDTTQLVSESYDMPFGIDNETAKVAILTNNGRIFLFGNGRVYAFINGTFTERGHITYTIDGETVDYADQFDDVDWIKTIVTEDKIYLLLSVDFYIPKPIETHLEILEWHPDNYSFNKTIARFRSNLFINRYDFVHYIGNNKALIPAFNNLCSDNICIYQTYFNLLDLKTGDTFPLQDFPVNTSSDLSILYLNESIYVLLENEDTRKTECYKIKLDHTDKFPSQINNINFLKHNEKLYAVWGDGNPYDGTWNFEQNYTNYYINSKNKAVRFYPSRSEIFNINDSYIGYFFNVNGNYLGSDRGNLYSLNSNFTIKEHIYHEEKYYTTPLRFNAFDSPYIACFSRYNSGKMDWLLYDNNLETFAFSNNSRKNLIAAFEDELIVFGYGIGSFEGTRLVTKINTNTTEKDVIVFDNEYAYCSDKYCFKRVDINENKWLAFAWNNYLAIGDLSNDIVAPEIQFIDTPTKVHQNAPLLLAWDVSDNKDEIQKIELYRIDNGQQTLIHTITDASLTSYPYTITETTASTIQFQIVAYDSDNNMNQDTIDIEIITPIVFNSFEVDKATINSGDLLTFTWQATGASDHTVYTVYSQTTDNENWKKEFCVVGKNNQTISTIDWMGLYTFKITADDAMIVLDTPITITGESISFDYSQFYPENTVFYTNETRMIPFQWAVETDLDDMISYELYIRKSSDDTFEQVADTLEKQFQYSVNTTQTTHLEWKIIAIYQQKAFESTVQYIQFSELISPELTQLKLISTNTLYPAVVIQFDPIGFSEYLILKKGKNGIYEDLATVSSHSYTDNAVTYDETYAYMVLSKHTNLLSNPISSRKILVKPKEIQTITFENENYAFLDTTEITLKYYPDADDCFENYEIQYGSRQSDMKPYTITQQRSLTITNLNYQTTYNVNIYPLDHNNERTSNQPQSLIFTTPPEPVPLPEINFSSISQVVSEQCEMITLTANLSSQGNEPITLSYSIKGTASLTDHDLMADQIIFHKGETQKIITFNIIDDTLVESDETLLITMNQMENANPGEITTHTVTIKDNDTQASLLVTPFFQDIPATDGFISFNILNTGSLDLNWHVSSLSSWLSVENSSSGINQGIVLVQHDFNPGQKRIGYLTISESDSPDISQTVIITQAANTPPYISKPYNITTYENMPAQLILSISDIETSADDLLLHASTSNPELVPDITITGKGNNRSLSIVPSMNQSGVAEITMTVSDGDLESFSHFSVTWIDNRNPTAEISYSITETTTQQVIATLIPDEDIIVINNNGLLSKTFTQNGDFTFHFIDKAGNSGNVTASVDWIILAGDINGDDKIDIKDVILMLMRLGE